MLFVMGDKQIWNRSRFIVNRLSLEYSVKFVKDYISAYKIIVEHYVDVMVCGPSEEKFRQNMADAYRFIESARKMIRYRETPMILISDVEDPSYYCNQKLSCFDIIDTAAIEKRLCQALGQALQEANTQRLHVQKKMGEDKLEARTLYIQNQNVLYPVRCGQVSHIQACNRIMEVCMQDGKRYFLRYITLQQLLEVADVWYFLQCSRSGIVNANYVMSIDYSNRLITMRNSDQIAIGSTYIKLLHEQFPTVQEVWLRKQQTLLDV